MILGILGGIYAKRRIFVESDRWQRTDRMQNLKDMKGYHFSNRGGVLFEKQFIGFEKYYRDDKALMDWYAKAYPSHYGEGSVPSAHIGGHH